MFGMRLLFPSSAENWRPFCSSCRSLMRSDNVLCFICAPVAQCWFVTVYWLLQTDFVDFGDIVLWSCSNNAIMPPKYWNNIHIFYFYYGKWVVMCIQKQVYTHTHSKQTSLTCLPQRPVSIPALYWPPVHQAVLEPSPESRSQKSSVQNRGLRLSPAVSMIVLALSGQSITAEKLHKKSKSIEWPEYNWWWCDDDDDDDEFLQSKEHKTPKLRIIFHFSQYI